MIRGIIFDCFGVLYHGSLNHLRDITPPEHINELNDLSRVSDLGYVSRDDYIRAVSNYTGRPEPEIERVINQDHIRNDAMVELARSLRADYKVALLSNVGMHVIDHLFSETELHELFEVTILSSDHHIAKPNPEIFALTAQRLGLLPEECVMIDDLEVNITGAKQAGMHGIVSLSTEQTATDLRALLAEQ